MKTNRILLPILILFFSWSLFAQYNDNVSIVSAKVELSEDYVPGEFIVKFNPTVAKQIQEALDADAPNFGHAEIDGLNNKYEVTNIDRVHKSLDPQKTNMHLAEKIGLTRTYVLSVPEGTSIKDAIAEYNALSDVAYAEPNYIDHIDLVPNDPTYSLQWGLNNTGQALPNGGGAAVGTPGADINIEPAWDLHTGDASVILAILDSGVDYLHPEFAGRTVPGYDTFDEDNDPMDFTGHGTSCAGIAAASGNNGMGVAGVNWNCMIMPVKIGADGATSFSHEDGAQGMVWAADNGAHVLSCSYGGSDSQTKQDGVDYAYASGCVILASRGNDNVSTPKYPASYTNVIAIGALSPCNDRKSPSTCDGETWWGSSFGSDLDVMAPGTRIHTTDITGAGGYDAGDYTPTFNGTSAACPFAAGVASLLISYKPGVTQTEVATAMRMSAVDIDDPGFDNQTGFGRLDAYGTLLYLDNVPPVAVCQDVTVSADENCQAEVTSAMIDNGSYDDNGDALTFELSPAGPYELGETEVILTVSDYFSSASCNATITVVDNTAPELSCPADITVSNDPGQCGAIVDFSVTVTDNCDNDVLLSISHSSGSFFPVGTTTVTANATDDAGNENYCSFDITVEDNEAPVITAISEPIVLWPPNHKYVAFTIDDLVVSVSDNCTNLDNTDVIISKGESDEPEDALGIGDGKTFDDIVITSECQVVEVRRERGEDLNGRVYTIHFEVADQYDNVGTASCEIHIPIMNNNLAINDGAAYTEMGDCDDKSSPFTQESDILSAMINAYPNPFNGLATINFEVPVSGKTTIKVYSSTGNHVATLFEGTAEKGHDYNVEFKAGNLPNGIYFYNMLTPDGKSITKKLVLN